MVTHNGCLLFPFGVQPQRLNDLARRLHVGGIEKSVELRPVFPLSGYVFSYAVRAVYVES